MSVCVHAHVCIGKSLCPCFPTHRLLEPHLEGISWKGWRAWKIKKHLKHSKIFKLSKQIGCVKYTSLHCRNVKLENLWNMHPSFPFSPFLALPHSFGLICSYDVTFSIKKSAITFTCGCFPVHSLLLLRLSAKYFCFIVFNILYQNHTHFFSFELSTLSLNPIQSNMNTSTHINMIFREWESFTAQWTLCEVIRWNIDGISLASWAKSKSHTFYILATRSPE